MYDVALREEDKTCCVTAYKEGLKMESLIPIGTDLASQKIHLEPSGCHVARRDQLVAKRLQFATCQPLVS